MVGDASGGFWKVRRASITITLSFHYGRYSVLRECLLTTMLMCLRLKLSVCIVLISLHSLVIDSRGG